MAKPKDEAAPDQTEVDETTPKAAAETSAADVLADTSVAPGPSQFPTAD